MFHISENTEVESDASKEAEPMTPTKAPGEVDKDYQVLCIL